MVPQKSNESEPQEEPSAALPFADYREVLSVVYLTPTSC